MHELLLWGLPLIGAPLLALRLKMARHSVQPSTSSLPLGQPVRDVGPLVSTTGEAVRLGLAGTSATVLVFMANRCPGVKAYDARLKDLHRRFAPQGVRFIGVNPVPEQLYPREGLDGMRKAAKDRALPFPYVKDRHQKLMGHLGAACTPQVFVLDDANVLRYKGRIDDSFIEAKARMHDLRDALNDVLARRPVARPETHPIGCAIDIGAPDLSPHPPMPAGVPA